MRSLISSVFLVVLLSFGMLGGCAAPAVSPAVSNPPAAFSAAPVKRDRPVLGLVLGGGATRGFAHVGAINALEAHGLSPDVVVGTSSGSIAGALYAGGIRGAALVRAAQQLSEQRVRDWVFPSRGFIRGERLQKFINDALENRSIQNLDKPFAAVATDLRTGALVAFNWGNTGMAVRASSSVPGVFQPVEVNGREYVDGGLVSPVPVRIARRMGADVIVAVDVSRVPDQDRELDSTLDVLLQTILIMGQTISRAEVAGADVLIRPELEQVGIADFANRERAIEQGKRAAEKAIPRIRELMR